MKLKESKKSSHKFKIGDIVKGSLLIVEDNLGIVTKLIGTTDLEVFFVGKDKTTSDLKAAVRSKMIEKYHRNNDWMPGLSINCQNVRYQGESHPEWLSPPTAEELSLHRFSNL